MKSHFVLGICVSLLLGAPLIAANITVTADTNVADGTGASGMEKPTVAITSHAKGDQVSSSQPVIVTVSASDDSGIKTVSLFTKGDQDAKFKWHGAITSEPYEWNLGILPAGTYMLLAKAVAGNNSEAKLTIRIKVVGSPVDAPPSTAGKTDTRDDMNSIKPVTTVPTAGNASPTIGSKDRIGWSSDGNTVDPDDWSATALALAIFAKMGWQDRLVHWDYNNRLDISHAWKEKENEESALGGARQFMFDTSKFFDDQKQLQAAIDHAAAEINKSSAESRFWYVQAGPFEVAYQAILKADPAKRKYCILVSHSAVNEASGKWKVTEQDKTTRPSAGKDECVALGADYFYTGVQGGTDKFGTKKLKDWSVVAWMSNSPCPEYRWVHSRFLKTAEHKAGCLDASDGGMAFCLATGDLNGNFDPKLKNFLGTSWPRSITTPPPMPRPASSTFLPGPRKAAVEFETNIPQLEFAARELDAALNETGKTNLKIRLSIARDAASPEAFNIKTRGAQIEVIGTDASGAMYGGLEVAEYLKLGLPIKNVTRKPFVEKRGIKFNIPLDVRNPSYDDSGDAAQENIENMWDFEGFWKPYIDGLARYRYNTLSLWSCHPYPQMVKLKDYPDCAAQDVYRAKAGALDHESKGRYFTRIFMMKKGQHNWVDGCLDTNGDGHLTPEDGTIELVKKMTIDEKIAHWTKVFKHAGDRGIQVTLFHWNVNVHGAKGHYGIEADQTNPKTIAYLRAAVKELVLTYPAITSIGVCAGETDDEELKGDDSTEAFIYKTYGLGVMDAQKERPDREIRFIWRNHSTEMEDVEEHFTSKYKGGPVDVEVKYVVGRIHSSRRPQEWEKRALKAGWISKGYRVWLNIRNDDLFMHRWGSPDYVRQFIRNMPLEHTPGFMMGSDGYVWGKVFYSTVPELQDQLEIDKHWYNFRMWGELAYNNELGDDYWTAALKQHFGLDAQSAKLLHDTWQTISEVVPQMNRAVYEGTDFALAPEGCMSGETTSTGFLTIPTYYYGEGQKSLKRLPQPLRNPPPAGEKPCISIPDWGKAYMNGKQNDFGNDKLTPLQVADNLDRWADAVDKALPTLQSEAGKNVELQDLVWDIQSMAWLGRYYADKQRCAAQYWVYRESNFDDSKYKQLHEEAIAHIKEAESDWEAYAAVLDKHYKPQLLARTHYLDWNSTLNNGEGSGRNGEALGVKQETQDIIDKKYAKQIKIEETQGKKEKAPVKKKV